MSDLVDIAVVGAGPAGLAAATAAAGAGARVAVIDAGGQPGGQYWRHPDERHPMGPEDEGHHDWARFTALRDAFEHGRRTSRIGYVASAQVWFAERAGDGWVLRLTPTTETAGAAPPHVPALVRARRLILCPGGYDRQLPIPGWELPGVMTAGGVQALLKGHRTLAGRRAVVAGTGPFLLPVATQLARGGASVVAVCEANRLTGWARHARAVAGVPGKLVEGTGYAAALARHRIPVRTRTVVTRIDPDATGSRARTAYLAGVDASGRVTGTPRPVEVDLIALGWGFTPSLELIAAVGAETRVDADRSLVAVVDDHQRSSVPGVYVAGEATGVGGALLALAEGELAGLAAAGARRARRVAALQRRIGRLRAFAAAMHAAHPVPARWHEWLTPETIVCRCEEADYASIRAARDELGAGDVRTVKLLARPGMGWCQGRVCGFATALLAAQDRPLTASDLRPVAKRSVSAPVTLSQLADASETS